MRVRERERHSKDIPYAKIINGNYSQYIYEKLVNSVCPIHLLNRPVPFTPNIFNRQLKLFNRTRDPEKEMKYNHGNVSSQPLITSRCNLAISDTVYRDYTW